MEWDRHSPEADEQKGPLLSMISDDDDDRAYRAANPFLVGGGASLPPQDVIRKAYGRRPYGAVGLETPMPKRRSACLRPPFPHFCLLLASLVLMTGGRGVMAPTLGEADAPSPKRHGTLPRPTTAPSTLPRPTMAPSTLPRPTTAPTTAPSMPAHVMAGPLDPCDVMKPAADTAPPSPCPSEAPTEGPSDPSGARRRLDRRGDVGGIHGGAAPARPRDVGGATPHAAVDDAYADDDDEAVDDNYWSSRRRRAATWQGAVVCILAFASMCCVMVSVIKCAIFCAKKGSKENPVEATPLLGDELYDPAACAPADPVPEDEAPLFHECFVGPNDDGDSFDL